MCKCGQLSLDGTDGLCESCKQALMQDRGGNPLTCDECGEPLVRYPVQHATDEKGLCWDCGLEYGGPRCSVCGDRCDEHAPTDYNRPGYWGYDSLIYGDEGTEYAGKVVCGSCYHEDGGHGVRVTFDDGETHRICGPRNETADEGMGEYTFTEHYHKTDGWRGYYDYDAPPQWVVLIGTTTAYEEHRAWEKFWPAFKEALRAEGIEYAVVAATTSNVFSVSVDVLVKMANEEREVDENLRKQVRAIWDRLAEETGLTEDVPDPLLNPEETEEVEALVAAG